MKKLLNKKAMLIIGAADILLIGIFAGIILHMAEMVKSVSLQRAADEWAGNSPYPYSVVSVYYEELKALKISEIYSLRQSIESKLSEKGVDILSEDSDESYVDCWYGISDGMAYSDRTKAEIKLFSVGGDYFAIHPYKLVSGCYISPDDINIDKAVIDDVTSWKLFGAVNTAGMTFRIGDAEFYISGVVEAPHKKNSDMKTFYDEMEASCVYIPFQADSAATETVSSFTGYDIILPDKISGFARDIVKNALGIKENTASITCSDSRIMHDPSINWQIIRNNSKDISSYVSRSKRSLFPFYKLAANSVELKCAVLYKFLVLILVPIVISFCFWLVILYILIIRLKKAIVGKISGRIEAKKLENYYKTHKKTTLIIPQADTRRNS